MFFFMIRFVKIWEIKSKMCEIQFFQVDFMTDLNQFSKFLSIQWIDWYIENGKRLSSYVLRVTDRGKNIETIFRFP